jgi:hypothetical protein
LLCYCVRILYLRFGYRLLVHVPLSTSRIPVICCRLCPTPCSVGFSFLMLHCYPPGLGVHNWTCQKRRNQTFFVFTMATTIITPIYIFDICDAIASQRLP